MKKKQADTKRLAKVRRKLRNIKLNEIKEFLKAVEPPDLGRIVVKGHAVYELRRIGTVGKLYHEATEYFNPTTETCPAADLKLAQRWAEVKRERLGRLEIIDIDEYDVSYQRYDTHGKRMGQIPINRERMIDDLANDRF